MSDSESLDDDLELEVDAKPIKQGYLTKQGGSRKNWKKRWFVLTESSLKYYKNPDKVKGPPLGAIYTRLVTSVGRTDEAGKPDAFAVQTPERTYMICGANDPEVQEWIAAIRSVLPRMTSPGTLAPVVKSGFLTKQGGSIKSWKRRWFVLRADKLLYYYKDEKEVGALGIIDLEKCTDVRVCSAKTGKEFSFEIVTADRVYPIFASSKAEMDEWMHTLLSLVGNVVGTTPADADDDDDAVSMDEIRQFLKTDSKITKEGYLTKQGGQIKSWRRRWFVLRESTLAYYKDNKSDTPLGLIRLADCNSFGLASRKVSKPCAFEVATNDRVYILVADSEEIMWDWINVLQGAVNKDVIENSADFRYLQKASELAAKQKALRMHVLRKNAVSRLAKLKSTLGMSASAPPPASTGAAPTRWARGVQDKVETLHSVGTEEFPPLPAGGAGNGSDVEKEELREQIRSMRDEINRLNDQLKRSSIISNFSAFDDQLASVPMVSTQAKPTLPTPIGFAQAMQDYTPNAYDDTALAFTAGEVIAIERKDSSGTWFGRIDENRRGTFPCRYVEEMDATTAGSAVGASWDAKLDDAAKSLFTMYDSDGDGLLTKLDFFEFLYEFGKTYLTDAQVERCWKEMDVSGTNQVNATEFRNGIKRLDEVEFYANWYGDDA